MNISILFFTLLIAVLVVIVTSSTIEAVLTPADSCETSYFLSSASPSPSSIFTVDAINAVLKEHNDARRNVWPWAKHMPMFKWNQSIANHVQAYLNNCPFPDGLAHSTSTYRTSLFGKYMGENLAAGSSSAYLNATGLKKATELWNGERSDYVYGCNPFGASTGELQNGDCSSPPNGTLFSKYLGQCVLEIRRGLHRLRRCALWSSYLQELHWVPILRRLKWCPLRKSWRQTSVRLHIELLRSGFLSTQRHLSSYNNNCFSQRRWRKFKQRWNAFIGHLVVCSRVCFCCFCLVLRFHRISFFVSIFSDWVLYVCHHVRSGPESSLPKNLNDNLCFLYSLFLSVADELFSFYPSLIQTFETTQYALTIFRFKVIQLLKVWVLIQQENSSSKS